MCRFHAVIRAVSGIRSADHQSRASLPVTSVGKWSPTRGSHFSRSEVRYEDIWAAPAASSPPIPTLGRGNLLSAKILVPKTAEDPRGGT